MRKRRKLLIAVLVLVVVFACIALLSGDKEPSCKGQTLSEWFAIYSAHFEQDNPESKAKTEEAKGAIKEIGTNALPILLKRIQYEPSLARIRFLKVVDKLPSILWDNRLVLPLVKDSRSIAAENATGIFVMLGAECQPAVPELTSLMLRTSDIDVVYRITFCLAAIGKDAMPSLIAALQHPELPCCRAATHWLGINGPFEFGTNVVSAVPLLARCATNSDPDLAK